MSEKLPQLVMERATINDLPDLMPPPGYTLRNYQAGDAAGLARVYAACDLGPATEEGVMREMVFAEPFRPERLFFLVQEGVIVAAAAAWTHSGFPGMSCLHMVVVHPDHRGKRLSAVLTVACLRQARREAFPMQRLQTDDWRGAALRVYIRLGYRPVYTHPSHPVRWETVLLGLGCPQVLLRARKDHPTLACVGNGQA